MRSCASCKSDFAIEPRDFLFYEKMQVPAPALCPRCRFMWRCLFRNERSLYNRTCDNCKASIISMYNPKLPYVVYCGTCWESDAWDPYAYAMDYDPEKPFFEQLDELLKKVPKKATFNSANPKYGPNVNSDYTNVASGNKNCYLIFNTSGCEETLYSRGIVECRDTMDVYFGNNMELSYEIVNGEQLSNVAFSQNVVSCLNSSFLLNCNGCQNCFGCVNMRHGSYCFLNEQLPKEEYERNVEEIRGSYAKTEEFRKKFEAFSLQFPRKENNNFKTVDSTGDYLFESKNLRDAFEVTRGEDSRYLFSPKFIKDSYDVLGYGYDSELLLECVGVGTSERIIGSYWVNSSHDVEYSFAVESGEYCFGCDGIKHGKYTILNKKYSKEEYEKLRSEIIAGLKKTNGYGLFMPPAIAPFAYNESVGQENIPLTKEEALKFGFRWEDDVQITKGKETMALEKIPDRIEDVKDEITKEIFACAECGRNYKIIPLELQLYKKMKIPIPRKCFNCRHADRIRRRGPLTLFDRACAKCGKAIKTAYAPSRPEIVYCEQCYQAEVA